MANRKQDSGDGKQQPGNKDADQRGSSSSSSASGAKSADIIMTPSTSQERPKTITGVSSGSISKQVRYSFQKKPFVIGVAGGTASGKSTVCSKIMEKLGPLDPKNSNNSTCSATSSTTTTTSSASAYLSANQKRVICISQDSFYRKLNEEDRAMVAKGNFNFDHPAAFDVPLLVNTLHEVLNGKMVKVPVYNYMENEISNTEEVIYPADVVLVEGLLLFYFPEVRDMFQMKIFVDTDPDTRLSRRVMRDVTERHRALDVVLSQYTKFVKPSFEEFCLPTKKYADIIVPRGPDNEVAVDLIVQTIRDLLANSGATTTGQAGFLSNEVCGSGGNHSREMEQSGSSILSSQSTPVTPVGDRHRLSPLVISNRSPGAMAARNRLAANINTLDSDDDEEGEDGDEPQRRIRHSSDSRQDISYNRTIH